MTSLFFNNWALIAFLYTDPWKGVFSKKDTASISAVGMATHKPAIFCTAVKCLIRSPKLPLRL